MAAEIVDFTKNFPPVGEPDWRDAVLKTLKGVDFGRLVTEIGDSIAVEPLYARQPDAEALTMRPAGSPWTIVQRVDHPDPDHAAAQALTDIDGGAGALEIVDAASPNAYGFGLNLTTDALGRVIRALPPGRIALRIAPGVACSGLADQVAAVITDTGLDMAQTTGSLGLDPIGGAAAVGETPADWQAPDGRLADLAAGALASGLPWRLFEADGRPYAAAGASAATELAAILATGIHYLRVLDHAGADGADLGAAIGLSAIADADQFLTLAKFRALRGLWRRVLDASGLDADNIYLHGQSSWRMMTRTDPHVNILRTTVAAFAAGLGGADSVTALPYTQAIGLPDGHARRIARNMQVILLEESNLHRVTDAGAGSGYVESLTREISERAWALLRKIEGRGGIVQALQDGYVQSLVGKNRDREDAEIAKRKHRLTGTSAFPNIDEAPASVLIPVDDRAGSDNADTAITPIRPQRMSAPFETLRDAARSLPGADGSGPTVFLANLGHLSDFTARASWAKNFFEIGGLAAPSNDGFQGLDALAAGFAASGARIAVLCGTDQAYDDQAKTAAASLTQAGAELVAMAGRPGDNAEALRAAGIDLFIYEGCDALDSLRLVHDCLAGR